MAILVTDPVWENRLRLEREKSGADRYDELWEGVYMMAAMPDVEHQQIVTRVCSILEQTVGQPGLGEVLAGVNLSEDDIDWLSDYRVPDVAVSLRGGKAKSRGTHWTGAVDFLVEVTSPGDRTEEKIPFYSRIGVIELLIVDRASWTLQLYRHAEDRLQKVAESRPPAGEVLSSTTVPLSFRLVAGADRPQIEIAHLPSGRQWLA
ncbi:MAG: Uma2 family endonuclease [Thermoguttaceae bacterium]